MKQNKTSLPIYFKIDIRSKIRYFTLPTPGMIIAEWLYYSKFSRNNQEVFLYIGFHFPLANCLMIFMYISSTNY